MDNGTPLNSENSKENAPAKSTTIGDIVGQESMREMIKSTVSKMPNLDKEEKKEHAKVLIKIFEKGMSPRQAMDITDKEMSVIYSYAYQLFNNGKIPEACELFKMLYVLDPAEPGLATALGVCHHQLKAYDLAATCYMAAATLNPLDPVPLFYAYDCFMNMNEKDSAIIVLYNVIDRSRGQAEYDSIHDKATIILEGLEAQMEMEQNKSTQG